LLETQGDLQMLSNPRVTATNNQKAVIKVGQDEYYPSVTETEEQLKVITLDDQRFELPLAQSNIRESDTVIRAQSGEIVVIGGLMQTTTEDEESKTPILGDVPILGNLFKSISKRQEKKELVILIKPTVVMPDAWKKQQAHSRALLNTWYEN